MVAVLLVHSNIGFPEFVAMVFLMFLVALAITALGLFVASFLTSLEGFNVIMNFIVLPMFFLSGALYPVGSLPPYIKVFAYVNPLCYGVDAFKHVLLAGRGALGAEFPIALDIAYITLFSVLFTFLSALVFERRK